MTVTVVLHLVSDQLCEGRLVGVAIVPRTGRQEFIRSTADLVALASDDVEVSEQPLT